MLSKKLGMALALFLLPGAVRADNQFPTLGAGGLVPVGSTRIQLESENLEITTRRITIHYVFRNTGDQEESTVFAFRLPDLDGISLCSTVYFLPRREINFVGFVVTSNGKAIPTQTEVRAFREGQDVTSRLTTVGLTPNVLIEALNAALLKVPTAQRDQLEAEGLIEPRKFNIPLEISGKKNGWCAAWTMRVQHSWTQVIPAHEAVEITHVYSPVVGGGYFMPTNDESAYARSYCGGPETLSAVAAMKAQTGKDKDAGVLLYEQAIEFLLTSANTWNGPIGSFHLTVLTKDPNDMLMTCMPGLQRTAPTRYEFEKNNFQPSEELRLMILQKARPWGW